MERFKKAQIICSISQLHLTITKGKLSCNCKLVLRNSFRYVAYFFYIASESKLIEDQPCNCFTFSGVELKNVKGIFLVLLFGCLLSLAALAVEIFIHRSDFNCPFAAEILSTYFSANFIF